MKPRHSKTKQKLAITCSAVLILAFLLTPIVLVTKADQELPGTEVNTVQEFISVNQEPYHAPVSGALLVTTEPPVPLRINTEGTVTANFCSAGKSFRSGEALLTINNRTVLLLHTSVPLWRTLETGDNGADVLALQEALVATGNLKKASSSFNPETLTAIKEFQKERKASLLSGNQFSPENIIWIPATEIEVSSCLAFVSQSVSSDTPVADLAPSIAKAEFFTEEGNPIEGDRVLRVGEESFKLVSPGNRVVDSTELKRLAQLPQLISTPEPSTTSNTIYSTVELTEALEMYPVPPSAIFAEHRNGNACILTPDGPIQVEIVASELGSSYVRPLSSETLSTVNLRPDRTQTCG